MKTWYFADQILNYHKICHELQITQSPVQLM